VLLPVVLNKTVDSDEICHHLGHDYMINTVTEVCKFVRFSCGDSEGHHPLRYAPSQSGGNPLMFHRKMLPC
jgi:hypothetical protein